jgi:hypothetical protein
MTQPLALYQNTMEFWTKISNVSFRRMSNFTPQYKPRKMNNMHSTNKWTN